MLSSEEEQLFQDVFLFLLRLDPNTEQVMGIDEIRRQYLALRKWNGVNPTFKDLVIATSQLSHAIWNKDVSLLKKVNE